MTIFNNQLVKKGIRVVSVADDKYSTCRVCLGVCTTKNIGNICWKCIEKLPSHIPDEQIMKYYKKLLEGYNVD